MSHNDAKYLQNVQSTSGIKLLGDVTGTTGANTVVKLQNVNIKTGTPSNNQLFTYVTANSRWEPVNYNSNVAVIAPLHVVTGSSNYTIGSNDSIIVMNTSSSININFPASSSAGRLLFFSDTLAGGVFTFVPSGGTQINNSGASSPYSTGILVCYDGFNWQSVAY